MFGLKLSNEQVKEQDPNEHHCPSSPCSKLGLVVCRYSVPKQTQSQSIYVFLMEFSSKPTLVIS